MGSSSDRFKSSPFSVCKGSILGYQMTLLAIKMHADGGEGGVIEDGQGGEGVKSDGKGRGRRVEK